jgi:Trk-type K+ transport system membrane component
MSYILVLLMAIGVVFLVMFVGLVLTCLLGVHLTLLLYPRRRCYKEDNQVSYNMISIRVLFLLIYFAYIFIDIIIYILRSTPWLFKIFWMVS